MTLPKEAASMSKYAMDGCEEVPSAKARKKRERIISLSAGEAASSIITNQSATGSNAANNSGHNCNNQLENTGIAGGSSIANGGRRSRGKVDGLMRRNRENTIDLLVAEAGLKL